MCNYVFEFVPNNLEMRIDYLDSTRKDMPMEEIRFYIKELLIGMVAIHSHGIIHRDIKPDNIFMSEDRKVVKFGDFGASKFETKSKPDYPTRVSTSYRAPELLFAATKYSTKIDIWALGCVFLELFVMSPVFMNQKNDSEQLVYMLLLRGGFNQEVKEGLKTCYLNKQQEEKIS